MINSKIFYNSKNVDFHSFIDLVAVLEPELLTDDYDEYCKMLIYEYQKNADILKIVELVRNTEVDEGVLEFVSYNSISVVIYNNGDVKYVACY